MSPVYLSGPMTGLPDYECDTIVMLAGWENSKGAHLELHLAHRMGLRVILDAMEAVTP